MILVYEKIKAFDQLKSHLITSYAAAVLLLFGGINEVNADPLTYEVVGDTVTIKDCKETASRSLVIPSAFLGKPVTSIGEMAFQACSGLTSVTIPESVTNIGSGAFINCTRLKSMMIPDSVIRIGSNAFAGCTKLKSVTIGNSVTSIRNYAFFGCSSLESVTIPDSVTSIAENTFLNCWSLKSVTIPNSVISIGESAFERCESLTSVTIPESVTSIERYAFAYSSILESINFEDNAPLIHPRAFQKISNDAKIIVYSGATGFGKTVGYRKYPVVILFRLQINSFSNHAAPFAINFETESDSTYIIEASHDLKKWGEIGEAQGTGSLVEFTDSREALFQKQYYRVKLVD